MCSHYVAEPEVRNTEEFSMKAIATNQWNAIFQRQDLITYLSSFSLTALASSVSGKLSCPMTTVLLLDEVPRNEPKKSKILLFYVQGRSMASVLLGSIRYSESVYL